MAIERMKKLRLLAVRDQKQALLKELLLLGCVEVSEPELDELPEQLRTRLAREGSDAMRCRTDYAALTQAIELLKKYAPEKGGLLSAKPETRIDELLDDSTVGQTLDRAHKIISLDEELRRCGAEGARLKSQADALTPWLTLDWPLERDGSESCAVTLGGVPAACEISTAAARLAEITDEAELLSVSSDKSQHYLALICFRQQLGETLEALREFGFAIASFGGLTGTARENAESIRLELEHLEEKKKEITSALEAMGEYRDDIKLCADRMETKTACAEAEGKLFGIESAVALQGWALERKMPELEKCLEKYDCAYEFTEPEPEEYPEVPVKLRNNKFTDALNMVTNMYSLPAYDGVDPNPLMAPFFILFYGLMMADMGYGIIMIAAALVAMKKIRPQKGTLSFCRLLLYAGISTFIMGILTGGFFGDALVQIGKILGKSDGWGELWCLFSPTSDVMDVLIGAMVLGFIHLNAGMVINVVGKVKRGETADAVWEEGATWVLFIGAGLMVLGVGNVAGYPVVLIIGCVMLFYGGSRASKGFGKVTSVFGTLYNTLTGWFGDILSYSRIMALMLAGSVIATVFNTIGAIANSLWLFIPVFLIGHALNFALNLLSCYVHDLRLQCLEFFGKFYKDGGRAFKPLEVSTKYYNIAK